MMKNGVVPDCVRQLCITARNFVMDHTIENIAIGTKIIEPIKFTGQHFGTNGKLWDFLHCHELESGFAKLIIKLAIELVDRAQ